MFCIKHSGVTPGSSAIPKFMKIGELAKKTGLTIDSIRFYEKSGLIRGPERTEAGYREFSKDAVSTVVFISHCRALDIPIAEIKKLLYIRSSSAKSCKEANQIIEDQLLKLRERIKAMKALEKQLAQLQSICHQELDPKDCPILKSLQKE